jgi:hypothetical protein
MLLVDGKLVQRNTAQYQKQANDHPKAPGHGNQPIFVHRKPPKNAQQNEFLPRSRKGQTRSNPSSPRQAMPVAVHC